MRLSEAIRLGSMIKPQFHGNLHGTRTRIVRREGFPWFRVETVDTSCALGAAYDASGGTCKAITFPAGHLVTPFRGKPYRLKRQTTRSVWDTPESPEILRTLWIAATCPACGKFSGDISQLIPHLNDKHRWTRERIADWVEIHELPVAEPLGEVDGISYVGLVK